MENSDSKALNHEGPTSTSKEFDVLAASLILAANLFSSILVFCSGDNDVAVRGVLGLTWMFSFNDDDSSPFSLIFCFFGLGVLGCRTKYMSSIIYNVIVSCKWWLIMYLSFYFKSSALVSKWWQNKMKPN